MNDATPIRDFRSQPTDEPVDLDEAVPAHTRTAEPLSEPVIDDDDLAPPPAESELVGAIVAEPEPASHPAAHPNEDVIDAIVDEPVRHDLVQREPLHHEPEPLAAPIEHAPAMEAAPAIVEPEPTVVPMESPPVAADTEDAASEDEQPNVVTAGIGILLVNLGTPDAAEAPAVRRYLKEFLSDPRVIERNGRLWRFVLNWLILPIRPRRKARDYAKIWNKERNESPIKTITRSQAEKLAAIIEPLGKHIIVDWAMRYGNPSIASRLEALVARGCERILVMPLYPQYAAATTATVCDEVFRYMMRLRKQPALRILPPYYDDPYYIEVLCSSLQAEIRALPYDPDAILVSYHGMPKEYVLKGDPYESQCVKTTELMRERMGLDDKKMPMAFQSRFGRGAWLTPYTIKVVRQLVKKKAVKNLVVITPGFSADCLETLEEIAVENAHVFKRAGGKNFAAIPCLNDSEPGMLVIWQLALRELKGWV